MNAEIITIGDELLIGQVVDTNSAFIAARLNLLGIKVVQITSISDQEQAIISTLKNAENHADLILITGGLGPTNDDITKQTLAAYFGMTLKTDTNVLNHVTKLVESRGLKMNERNIKQAEVPDKCTVIHNPVGTAPCMWFEKENKVFVSMPGVPFEMETIMKETVLDKIKNHFKCPVIIHKTIMTFGIPESELAHRIESWENSLPEHIKLAYLPSPEGIRLRLSGYGDNAQIISNEINIFTQKLTQFIPEAIYGYDEETMAEAIGKKLVSLKKTVAVAESCTGGHLSKLITAIPGCSAFYNGGVIAYANSVKMNVLNVEQDVLDKFGAVSEQTVKQMAEGVRKLLKTDYAIATSGIAGPDGGTPDKPVGTVWIAVASPTQIIAIRYQFGKLRDINIRRAANTALNMLRGIIE